MGKKRNAVENIINKLREAEVRISQGLTVEQASRKIGVTQQTYYRQRKEYGGLRLDQAKRFKEMEDENVRLKNLLADLAFDNSILKEVCKGKF